MITIPKKFFNTLPSVEQWGTNMDIERDPPKQVWTRRVDKVADTQILMDMVESSGDRVSEAIQLFPRGVNPMVSVQYGTNPYKIMEGGAFRPPIMRQEDLLPLSRQPRGATSADTNREEIQNQMIAVERTQYESSRYLRGDDERPTHTPIDRHVATGPAPTNAYMFDPNVYLRKRVLHVPVVEMTVADDPRLMLGANERMGEWGATPAIRQHMPVEMSSGRGRDDVYVDPLSCSTHTNQGVKSRAHMEYLGR